MKTVWNTEVGQFYIAYVPGAYAKFKGLNHTIWYANEKDIKNYLVNLGTGKLIDWHETKHWPNEFPNIDIKRKLKEVQEMKRRTALWMRRRRGQYEVYLTWVTVPYTTPLLIDLLFNKTYLGNSDSDISTMLDMVGKKYPDGLSIYANYSPSYQADLIGVQGNGLEVICHLDIAKDLKSFKLSNDRHVKFFQSDEYVRDYFWRGKSPAQSQ